MRQLGVIFFLVLALLGGEAFARGSRGGSFGGSRSSGSSFRSSSSRSSSSRSTTRRSTVKNSSRRNDNNKAVVNNNTTRPSTNRSTVTNNRSTNTTRKPAVSNNRADRKLQKAQAQRNNAAGAKYGSKKAATAAYSNKLAKQNRYTSSTAPTTRPRHIPQTTSVGGRSVNVTYNVLPGGGYGYGYMDPTTGVFMALTANQMMVNNAMLTSAGYGTYNASGAPVVVRTTPVGYYVFGSIFGLIILILVIVAIKENM